MKKNIIFLCSLLFLFPAMHAMETSASNASSDDVGPYVAMIVPPEITEKIMYELIHGGTALDILNTHLACKLFYNQLKYHINRVLSKDKKALLQQKLKDFLWHVNEHKSKHPDISVQRYLELSMTSETVNLLDIPLRKEDELVFKLRMATMLGNFENKEKDFILQVISYAIKHSGETRLENLLHYVITITSEEKKKLLAQVEENRVKKQTQLDVYDSLSERRLASYSRSTGNFMESVAIGQCYTESEDHLSLIEEELRILENMKSIIENAPVQEESSNNNK